MGVVNLLAGLLLVVLPVALASMLGMAGAHSEAPAALCGIGVLVGGMGLAYFVVLVPFKGGKTVWYVTSLLHGVVGVSLIWLLALDWLPSNWLPVAVFGLLVALVQVAVLRAGWWTTMIKWQNYQVGRARGGAHLTLPT